MDTEFKMLQWTVPNFALWISTDVSTNGWWATCQGMSIGGLWSQEEQKAHTNILEMKVVHLAMLTFTKFKIVQWIHVQMDNKVALNYLRVLLSFWLMFCQFRPGVAYKNVANKKSVYLQKFSRF